MAWNKKLVMLVLAVAQFHYLEATETAEANLDVQNGSNLESENGSSSLRLSPAMDSIMKELMRGSKISLKASSEEDSSSDDFVHSLWGAFVFSIIGIAAFVVFLALLLQFVCHNEKPRAKPPKPSATSPTAPDFNNQPNPTFRNAAALSEETRNYAPPVTGSYENHAMSMDYDYDDDNRMSHVSPYPVQQYQHQTSLTNYNYQSSSFSPGMHPDYAEQQLETPQPQVSHSNFTFSPSPAFETEGHQVPAPDYESQAIPGTPAPISPFVPIIPMYGQGQSKSMEESEYNYNYNQSNNSEYYREKVDEPFKYLDNYAPYSANPPQDNDKSNLTELSTKRAVLRNSTPYKFIEERVQGEDYDDTDTFVAPTQKELMKPPHQKPQLSSDSFNDGKSKLVRVLPRFHHVPSQQHPNQLQQMGAGSTAVFKSVAPAPPPPPPDYIQQPIYAVSQKQF